MADERSNEQIIRDGLRQRKNRYWQKHGPEAYREHEAECYRRNVTCVECGHIHDEPGWLDCEGCGARYNLKRQVKG